MSVNARIILIHSGEMIRKNSECSGCIGRNAEIANNQQGVSCSNIPDFYNPRIPGGREKELTMFANCQ